MREKLTLLKNKCSRIPLLPVLLAIIAFLAFTYGQFFLAGTCAVLFILLQALCFSWRICLFSVTIISISFPLNYRSHQNYLEGQKIYNEHALAGIEISSPRARVLTSKKTANGYSAELLTTSKTQLVSTPSFFPKSTRFQAYFKNPIKEGEVLSFTGRLTASRELKNFGEFDWSEFYQKKHIVGAIRIEKWEVKPSKSWQYYSANIRTKIRESILKRLLLGIDSDSNSQWIIPALILGLDPSENQLESYRNAGVMHLFVVSGLHVGFVLAITWILLYFTKVSSLRILSFSLVVIWIYIFITGLEPPALRAGIIISILSLGFILKQRVNPWNSLIAALVCILLLEKNALLNVGVLLSFGVVASLIFIVRTLVDIASRPAIPDTFLPRELWSDLQSFRLRSVRWILGVLAVATVSWITSSIITALSFERVYLFGVISSLILFPLAFSMMVLSAFSLLIGIIHPSFAIPVNRLNATLAEYSHQIVEKVEQHPRSVWVLNSHGYNDSLTVFNTPKGSAALYLDIEGGILIDCGKDWIARSIISPCLKQSGKEVSTIFLSHSDSAHTGGASEFPNANIIQSYNLPATSYKYGKVTIETIPLMSPSSSRADDNITLFRIITPSHKIGYLSDSGILAYQELSKRQIDFSCDLLIAGNHAQGENAIEDFVNYTKAEKVIFLSTYFHMKPRINSKFVSIYQQESGATQILLKK